MGLTLFRRSYRLTLGTLARPGLAVYGNLPGSITGKQPTPLRVEFDVDKTCTPAANQAHIRITNMNDGNRANMKKGIIATLEVGYQGEMQVLFVGGIVKALSERQGAEITTSLELGDAEASIQNVTLDKTYGPGTSVAQVITDICLAMQLPTPAQPQGTRFSVALGTPSYRFAKGLSVHGPVRGTLTKLCRTYGLEWSIQNGAMQILPLGSHTGLTAQVLNQATGLLGVPSFDGTTCVFDALLNPRLTPGCLVAVQSNTVNGFFKVRKGKWAGDSYGADWSCKIEATPVAGVQAALPQTSLPLAPGLGA